MSTRVMISNDGAHPVRKVAETVSNDGVWRQLGEPVVIQPGEIHAHKVDRRVRFYVEDVRPAVRLARPYEVVDGTAILRVSGGPPTTAERAAFGEALNDPDVRAVQFVMDVKEAAVVKAVLEAFEQ